LRQTSTVGEFVPNSHFFPAASLPRVSLGTGGPTVEADVNRRRVCPKLAFFPAASLPPVSLGTGGPTAGAEIFPVWLRCAGPR
jgi:hypothetical protein